MDLKNKRIIFASDYFAPYEGNFIYSLRNLEKSLSDYGCIILYVFPNNVSSRIWFKPFSMSHLVALTGINRTKDFYKIVEDFEPDIIHTHFEGFDIASSIARDEYKNKYGKDIHLIWHMHDHLSYHHNMIKRLYQHYCFFKHYNIMAKSVNVIAVCDHELQFATNYKRLLGGDFTSKEDIPNGINTERISISFNREMHQPFTFIAFWGRLSAKRCDLLLLATKKLLNKGYNIHVLLTRSSNIDEYCKRYGYDSVDWLTVIDPQDDINEIFSKADCFVSTSVGETFSYGICEASIFGLPVIQSDIEGTMWNKNNPSTFVFKSLDIDDLAKCMIRVISMDHNEIMQRCEITSLNNVRDYSINAWTKKVLLFYQNL